METVRADRAPWHGTTNPDAAAGAAWHHLPPMAAPTPSQWAEIRTIWLTTGRPGREIAREFGVSEAAIRKRAGNEVWGPRNAPEQKRALVRAATSGTQIGAQCAPGADPIRDEADRDIRDMECAARVGRSILDRCEWLLSLVEEKDGAPVPGKWLCANPKDLKATAEAARAAMEMIRRARNLDEPGAAGETTIDWGDVVGRRQ